MAKGKNYLGGGFSGQPQRQSGGGDQMRQSQKAQEEIRRTREALEAQTYEATAGGGMIRAVVSGKKALTALEISPAAVAPGDIETLQDMIIAAVNEALQMSERAAAEHMGSLTGGLNLRF